MLVAEPIAGSQRIVRSAPPAAVRRAHLLLWVAFALFVAGVGIGTGWDRRWHATHPFEDFWSPPHLFIYTCLLLTVGAVAIVIFSPALRDRFGADVRLPLIPLGVPAPLLLLSCGLTSLGLAGLLDGVWHAVFGLDETGWSLPHALLGHGILLTFWGFVAARLALCPFRPLSWLGRLLFGFALLATAQDLLGGPLMRNISPRSLAAIAALPVLAADPRAQHTFRIYLAWHVDRTNPLYLPLAAFTTAFGLALVRWLASAQRAAPVPAGDLESHSQHAVEAPARWETGMLAPAAMVALVAFLGNPQLGLARLWEPLPFFLAAGAFLLARRAGVPIAWAWMVAGWVTCFWLLVFVHQPALALLAGPLALAGAWAGQQVAGVIERPAPRTLFTLTGVVAGAIPVLMGALDLYLRAHTP